jgi:hypothetical protein
MVKELVPLGKISKGKGEQVHQPVFKARLDLLPETKVRIKRKKKLWRA